MDENKVNNEMIMLKIKMDYMTLSGHQHCWYMSSITTAEPSINVVAARPTTFRGSFPGPRCGANWQQDSDPCYRYKSCYFLSQYKVSYIERIFKADGQQT